MKYVKPVVEQTNKSSVVTPLGCTSNFNCKPSFDCSSYSCSKGFKCSGW